MQLAAWTRTRSRMPTAGAPLVFGAVKVAGYAEYEAAAFMLADVVLLGLIARLGR